MSNVCAGIGRGQMEVLPERVRQRRAVYDRYVKALDGLPGISFVPEPAGFYSNRWLTTIQVNPAESGGITREDIRLALEAERSEEHTSELQSLMRISYAVFCLKKKTKRIKKNRKQTQHIIKTYST